jgi:tyrosinase
MRRPYYRSHLVYALVMLFLWLGYTSAYGQGIRKHYTQLTESERAALVAAIDQLKQNGIQEDYADIHTDPDHDGQPGNNFNGPDTDSQIHRVTIFLSWHRAFTAYYERELQAIDPRLSLPYWDWTGDLDPVGVNSRSALGPLWNNDQVAALGWTSSLLGKYDNQGQLGRDLGGILPTSSQKQNLITSTAFNNFGNFRFELEVNLHDPPHGWVGGEMQDMYYSPRDPAFFLHHAMVDYLWQLWTENGHSVSFSQTSMPTFDGTVPGFERIDPDDIRNSVTQMGIYYAKPSITTFHLKDYTVHNDHLPVEFFVYPKAIEVESTFQIAAGAEAEIHSCESVVLKPGFKVLAGSTVRIGTNGFCNTPAAKAEMTVANDRPSTPSTLEEHPIEKVVKVPERVTLKGFPNPFEQSFTFQFTLPAEERVSMVLMDAVGRIVATPMPSQRRSGGEHQLLVDAHTLPSGMYTAVLRLHDSDGRYVLRVVKAD